MKPTVNFEYTAEAVDALDDEGITGFEFFQKSLIGRAVKVFAGEFVLIDLFGKDAVIGHRIPSLPLQKKAIREKKNF